MTGDPEADGREVGGRYRLLSSLGRGGMGVVWAAHDQLLDREVAIKEVTYPHTLDEQQRSQLRERTMREARAAARISSSAAVTVYDVVEEDGRPWIVMELLPARSLADVLREQGPLGAEEAARLGLRLVDALAAAHRAGVLHRDVKPANVLYDASGQAVLTDFGIASLEGDSSLTTTGAVIGSPGYVAPERAHGLAPSAASDVWSLGVTLATALHGRSPFERDTALATMVAAIQEPLPEQVGEGPLGAVISRLLRKDPADRPGVDEARVLLTAALTGSTDGPTTADPDATTTMTSPVRPAAAAGAASAAGGSAGASGASGASAATGSSPPATVEAERTQALPLAAPPRPGTTPQTPHTSGRRSRALPVLVAVVSLVVAGMVLAVVLDRTRGNEVATGAGASATTEAADPTADPAPPQDEPTAQAPAEEPSASAPPDERQEEDEDAQDGESEAAGATPDGFRLHEDAAYQVAVPEGWTVEPDGDTRTRFVDPESRRYLLVEEGGEPAGDPVEDWERQEGAVAERLDGYERISIEAADYRDFDAADWQFTWEPSGGTLRVLNRAVVADDQAFALYWSVPEEEWDSSRDVLDDIAATFQPSD